MQKLTCVGYHDTGAGAAEAFVKEFIGVSSSVGDMECRILQDPDGISDLEYNLIENPHRLNSGFAIKRFRIMLSQYRRLYTRIFGKNWINITEEYLSNLTKVNYKGYWHADTLLINPLIRFIYQVRRKINKMLPKPFSRSNWYNYFPKIDTYHTQLTKDAFLQHTRNYIDRLCLNFIKDDTKIVILDQLVHPNNVPRYLRYVNNLKVIIVDRDPRDVYIHQMLCEEHTLPKDPNQFCVVFKDNRIVTAADESGSTLYIQFEDLIYNYENTTHEIMKFLDLKQSDHSGVKIFDEVASKRNTRLWEQFPQFAEAVRIIEKELPEFLYQYE